MRRALPALLLALFCAGCERAQPVAVPLELTIAVVELPAAALIHVAEAQGYFRKEGVNVRFNTFALGRDALDSALEGKSDLATVYDLPVARRLCEGKDIVILTTLHRSSRSHAILARRDRGIERLSDLRGKRIGVTRGISADYFLSVFLASNGLAASAVNAIPLEPADYEQALLEGRVDALSIYSPMTFKVRDALGAGRAAIFYSDLYAETSVLAGRRDLVAAKREAATRALRAIVRAEAFVRDNPDESLRIVVARLGKAYSEPVLRENWNAIRVEARLDNVLLTQLMQQGNWLREVYGYPTPPPDFGWALAADYLAAVRPRSVTVLTDAGIR